MNWATLLRIAPPAFVLVTLGVAPNVGAQPAPVRIVGSMALDSSEFKGEVTDFVAAPAVLRSNVVASVLSAGEVEIAPYGEPEDLGAFASAGIGAVRFDPPFEPPYEITRITFPSFTLNGTPAVFPSVRLCEFDPVVGLVRLETPLVQAAPYVGSSNGLNEVPVHLQVTGKDKIFYWCVDFPSQSATFPNDYPFLRWDARDTERGEFGASFIVTHLGAPVQILIGNMVVSMVCRVPSADLLPIEASGNLGANRRENKFEFSFERPRDIRADGAPMPRNSLRRTDLLFRPAPGPWKVVASAGAGSSTISIGTDVLDSLGGGYWTTQAVDKNGRRAIQSNFVWVPHTFSSLHDRFEPNGRINEATPVTPSPGYINGTPAGDRDFWTFQAKSGDVISAFVSGPPLDGINDMSPVLLLYDSRGRVVASDQIASITYRVPRRPGSGKARPERFTLLVTDAPGTIFSPTHAPRLLNPASYDLIVSVSPADGRLAGDSGPLTAGDSFRFTAVTPSGPAAPHARFVYTVPPSVDGARVTMRIYDVRGRLVRTVVDRAEHAGTRTAAWDATDRDGRTAPSGTYYAHLEIGGFRASRKVTIIR